MASIVPTPNGLNDSPTGVRTAFVIPNGPTSADPRNARLSSSSRYNASGMTKYLFPERTVNSPGCNDEIVAYVSNRNVTGPSFIRCTCISAPNWPAATTGCAILA
ncbi:hypothetical protein ALQ33_101944 [Pseudomonas syringae pv. philadelphi]|uniref:Uncharacterized protein n=1 Tax=Pseudomonas syringae pv. philadelphi TaxID=251706 RepID=A0A3M3YX01_9PSED|nr:hypothetical protein ALQ33_101944 [Pseudomonas syringae pv. philadelphi]